MAKDLGWIRLHRSSFNNRMYFAAKFTRWQAWCDLLLLANHKDGWIRKRGIKVDVKRGEVGYSVVELANRWRWSRGTAIRYLNELENDYQIVQQKTNAITLISIVNYNKYQTDGTANDTQHGTANGTANEQKIVQQTVHEQESKEVKEVNINKNKAGAILPPAPPENFYKAENFNGLPERWMMDFINLVRVVRQIDLETEVVSSLWEIFKNQNLTGENPYQSEAAVYKHFINWGKQQGFKKKTVPKEKKNDGKIVGVEFINDFKQCKMSDGSVQDLDVNQQGLAKYNQINPKSIIKK